METQSNHQGNSSQQDTQTFKHLKFINSLIKGKATREEGFSKLRIIDKDNLPVGLQIYYHYLTGKYHSLRFRETDRLEELESANDFFDEIIFTARDNNIFIKNKKYLFVRAHCKFEIAKALVKKSSKEHFYQHSRFLTQQALKYNPDCKNLQWLLNEINSVTI